MKDFISAIKRINTDGLIYAFSDKSIKMFNQNKCMMDVEIPVIRLGRHQTLVVTLTAWDINNIEFLSVIHSNDFRHSDKMSSPNMLVDMYRDYDNEHSAADTIKGANTNSLFRTLLGMTAEQFLYQDISWVFDKFDRDYYILHAAQGFPHKDKIDISTIVRETFGCSVDEYITILITVFWLSKQHPDILSAPESMFDHYENPILTKDNIEKVVKYYSCSYDELRKSVYGKQLLYSKPFIKTQRGGRYLSSNVYLVAMAFANGLYWLARDYYRSINSQNFVNSFGDLFEDYIKDIATTYCSQDEWHVLPKANQKGADFFFDFGRIHVIVEAKSTLLRLDAKQQVPVLQATDIFFARAIGEAYEQLQSTYAELEKSKTVPIIKVILLYDQFSNPGLVEKSMTEIFDNDPLCFVMTIRDWEILLYLHHNDPEKQNIVLDAILDQIDNNQPKKTFATIFKDLSIHRNPHFEGELDFFSQILDCIDKTK